MRSARSRLGLSLGLLVLAAGAASAATPLPVKALKAAEPEKSRKVRELPGEPVEFKTVDGWTLKGQYLPSGTGKWTFILLHEAGGSKQNWYWISRKMKARGLGFLALDLRGHGLSQAAPEGQPSSFRRFKSSKDNNDWDNMREDISSAVAFLKEKGVDPVNVALGGAAVGGSVAIRYAALHPEVPLVFLLSPGMSHQGVPTPNALRAYKKRPLLLVVGDDDKRSSAEIPIIFQFARLGAGAENVYLLRVPRGHGTRMLYYNRGVMDRILDWAEDPTQSDFETSISSAPSAGAAAGVPATAPQPPASRDGLPTEDELDKEYGDPPKGGE